MFWLIRRGVNRFVSVGAAMLADIAFFGAMVALTASGLDAFVSAVPRYQARVDVLRSEASAWLVAQGRAELDDVTDYRALHAWSVAAPGDFWAAVADFFEVDWGTAPRAALAERRMPGAVWFPGGTLNFGGHLLRAGDDDRDAVVLVTSVPFDTRR